VAGDLHTHNTWHAQKLYEHSTAQRSAAHSTSHSTAQHSARPQTHVHGVQLDQPAWLKAGGHHDVIGAGGDEVRQGGGELDHALDAGQLRVDGSGWVDGARSEWFGRDGVNGSRLAPSVSKACIEAAARAASISPSPHQTKPNSTLLATSTPTPTPTSTPTRQKAHQSSHLVQGLDQGLVLGLAGAQDHHLHVATGGDLRQCREQDVDTWVWSGWGMGVGG